LNFEKEKNVLIVKFGPNKNPIVPFR